MNTLSGYIELDLNGEVLPFKFGTNSWALFCEMRKVEFGHLVDMNDFSALRDLFYCAYMAVCRSRKEEPKYNVYEFCDLLDETPGALLKLKETMLTSKIMGFSITELTGEGKPGNF